MTWYKVVLSGSLLDEDTKLPSSFSFIYIFIYLLYLFYFFLFLFSWQRTMLWLYFPPEIHHCSSRKSYYFEDCFISSLINAPAVGNIPSVPLFRNLFPQKLNIGSSLICLLFQSWGGGHFKMHPSYLNIYLLEKSS